MTDKLQLWVSIPVTTIMIEQPSMLEAIKDAQLGFTLGTRTPMQGLRITNIYKITG